ncbi:MAG: RluA family pseudouridine synthase [Actinomycetaceae bacterium]|nr:RluA family pseudouridine synthase [Actinomycetaceae bacterium]
MYMVPDGLGGMRTDAAVSVMTGLSRSTVAKMCDENKIFFHGKPLKKSEKVVAGSILDVELPMKKEVVFRSSDAEIPLLYEDDDIVVIDKPHGLASHPSLNFEGPDVLGTLRDMGVMLCEYGPQERHGIVHRLDVGTSGCLVLAKSNTAYSVLKDAFRYRKVKKVYHALVQGHPDPFKGTVDAPIGHSGSKQWKMAIVEGGRPSITHYVTLEVMPGAALLEVNLETGRTHQIRVHMSAIGHPCVGDGVYGADPSISRRLHLERQWLHARRLSFTHPLSEEWMTFEAPYPKDLDESLNIMREGIYSS